MIELTADAKQRLDQYLSEVANSLRDCKSVDFKEVQRDVREHIERELQGRPSPVGVAELEEVLGRLGSPQQWVPEGDMSLWQRFTRTLRGPDASWRLAWVAFGLFTLAAICAVVAYTVPSGSYSSWTNVESGYRTEGHSFERSSLPGLFTGFTFVLILASFVLGRAFLACQKPGGPPDPRVWLVGPGLVVVYLPLAAFILSVLPTAVGGAFYGLAEDYYRNPNCATWRRGQGLALVTTFVSVAAAGVWWIILGAVLRSRVAGVQAVFRPCANWFTRRSARGLMIAGACLLVLSAAAALLVIA